jgi:hypothetical protein
MGLALACLSPSCFFAHPDWSATVRLFVEVAFAPLALLGRTFLHHQVPPWLIAIAVVAIVAFPIHSLRAFHSLRDDWTAAVTAAGFLTWFSCQVLVALLPA